jgi:hypothetical protein
MTQVSGQAKTSAWHEARKMTRQVWTAILAVNLPELLSTPWSFTPKKSRPESVTVLLKLLPTKNG